MRALLRLLSCLLVAIPLSSLAGECTIVSKKCIDGPATRNVGGATVTRDCWEYENVYECTKPGSVDTCEPLAANASCAQTYSSCTKHDDGGVCTEYSKTYNCADPLMPTPAGTTRVVTSPSVGASGIDRSACAAIDSNPACTLVSKTCLEGPETRTIDGVAVTKDCWKWREEYGCASSDVGDQCQVLVDQGCSLVSSSCAQTNSSGACVLTQKAYSCVTKPASTSTVQDCSVTCANTTVTTPATYKTETCSEYRSSTENTCNTQVNVVVNSATGTLISADLDTSQCSTYANNTNCQKASSICTQPGGTRVVNGVSVTKDCWAYTDTYACLGSTLSGNCSEFVSKGCSLVSSSCSSYADNGACTLYDKTYSCLDRPATTKETQDCTAKQACVGETCWQTGSPKDTDFALATTMMEVARQGSTYVDENGVFFNGTPERCGEGLFGMKNCCKSKGGARSNNSIMTQLMFSGATAAAKYGANIGSRYMFDFMYPGSNAVNWSADAVETLSAMAKDGGALFGPTSFTPSIGMYGISLSTAVAPTSIATMLPADIASSLTGIANITNYSNFMGSGFTLSFDPWSLALSVAIQLVMDLMTCNQDEVMLQMHKGAGLCHYNGRYCKRKWPLVGCVEHGQSYCCFNSKLAKLVQEGGRQQLNMPWETFDTCKGFTQEQIAQIDFSKIDFSDFMKDTLAGNAFPTEEFFGQQTQVLQTKGQEAAASYSAMAP